jgi:NAD(P)-dependent dehydrogenase (short-subunit alcohol dehydrogenase family)
VNALISGASGDIGSAIEKVLNDAGYAVCPSDIGATGNCNRYRMVDVSNSDQVAEWIREFPPDVCVVNAGIVRPEPTLEASGEVWLSTFAVNLYGAVHFAGQSAKAMIEAGTQGSIVFVGSWVADHPDPKIGAYCASKAALRSYMQCLAIEVASFGIRVNEVAPGYVDAGVSAQMYRADPSLKARSRGRVPLNRLVSVEQVAEAVLWLVQNPVATGSVLTLDAGLSLGAAWDRPE